MNACVSVSLIHLCSCEFNGHGNDCIVSSSTKLEYIVCVSRHTHTHCMICLHRCWWVLSICISPFFLQAKCTGHLVYTILSVVWSICSDHYGYMKDSMLRQYVVTTNWVWGTALSVGRHFHNFTYSITVTPWNMISTFIIYCFLHSCDNTNQPGIAWPNVTYILLL